MIRKAALFILPIIGVVWMIENGGGELFVMALLPALLVAGLWELWRSEKRKPPETPQG